MLNRIRTRAADERGAVLVMVAILMIVILASAALAIDATSWTQTQRQAQNAADDAALAAADLLPATDTTAAKAAAVNYVAASNLPGAQIPLVSFSTAQNQPCGVSVTCAKVTVTATTKGQTTLGAIVGVKDPAISQTAVAAPNTTSTAVAGPMFAGSTSCSAITLQNNNNAQVGGIVTNGSVSVSGSNGTTVSSLSYGANCSAPSGQNGVTFGSTTSNSGSVPFPIDYRTQAITCNSGQSVTQSGNNYTYGVSNITFSNSQAVSGVYCAQTINLANSAVLTGTATFIADNFGGGISDTGTLTPAFNHLLLWQTGSSTLQLNSTTFINGGVIFAPSAEILVNSNALTGGAQTTFLESDTIWISSMNGGSLQAPSGLTSGSTTNGSSLTQ